MANCYRARLISLMVCACSALLASCGGNTGTALPDSGSLVSTPALQAPTLPESLFPVFPDAQFEREHPAQVSVMDNKQTGSQVLMTVDPGATVNGSALDLNGDAGPVALWGIWRWSNFQSNYPIKLLIDFSIESGGEFYVLRTNYGTGRWEVVGPLPETFSNDGRTTYPVGDYVSTNNNSYVAILTTAGTDMSINELNLLSDDDLTPPSVPQNLISTDVQPGSISLDWDDVSDLTLDGYNVYSGPTADFQIGGPGVEQLNLFPVSSSDYSAMGLVPNTTYFLAVSSVDLVGNESALSNVVEETTTNDDPPGIPTDLTVGVIGSVDVNLSWTAPADPDIQGYNVYIGDTPDFDLADGVKQEGGLYPGTSALREGLEVLTEYYARVTAVDVFNSEGPPSASVNFTTLADALPQPDFIFSPGYPQKDTVTIFNPSSTFDPDTDIAELTFEWDFDDDDVIDETTIGPSNVNWTFDAMGSAPVTLTVSDATSSVDKTENLFIYRRYQRFNLGNGTGNAGSLVDVATNAETGQVAIVYRDDNNALKMRYFNGSIWSIITMPPDTPNAICVTPLGPAALYVTLDFKVGDGKIFLNVQRYTGTWTTVLATTINNISEPIASTAYLAGANNDRYSMGLVYFPKPGFGDPNQNFHVWHEKADGSLNNVDVLGGTRIPSQLPANAVVRNDDSTFVLDNIGGNVNVDLITITDGGTSEQSSIQTITGTPSIMKMDNDPDSPGQVFWGMLTNNNRIYYGDNYGTANGGSQFVDASSAAAELCGVGLDGDNESLVYWINRYSSGHEELMGYTTSTSTQHMIGSGLAFSNNSAGGYSDTGVNSGVWVAVQESRDGQVIARFLRDDTLLDSLIVHEPAIASSVFTKASPVVFADDSIYSLHSQGYPVALAGSIPANHSTSTTGFYGKDSYVIPHAACPSSVANEYMVASNTTDGNLVVNSLQKGLPLSTESLLVEGTGLMDMAYNPASTKVMLVYGNTSNNSLAYQTWDGLAWSGVLGLVPPGAEIKRIALAVRNDGEFGLVYTTDADSLQFAETSGGVWGVSSQIYSGALNNITSFIGLSYNANDRAAVVAQRSGAGIWLGLIPDGGSVSWEEVDPLDGLISFSLDVTHGNSLDPTIVYLKGNGSLSESDLYTNELVDGSWTPMISASVVKLLGIPLGVSRDSSGNVIVSGADKSTPAKAICVIFED